MKRTTAFLATALLLSASSLFVSAGASARDRELELRGTLLCRTEGDARRERPMDAHYLVIEPVGYPENSEMLGEAGLFRIRVPYDLVDHQVVLKIYRGSESVDVIQTFIEPGKVRRMGDKYYYSLTSHVLPGRCEDMVGNADLALAFRDQLRMSAVTADRGSGGISKPAAGGIVATLLGAGAYAASAATGSSAQFKGNTNLVPEISPIVPGDWPVYSQFSSSPALGRTLTSFRHFGEAPFWNPSLMVRQAGHHLSASGGMRNEWRAAGAYRIPYRSEEVSPFLPRVVTAGFIGYDWSHEKELSSPGLVRDILENHHEERTINVGLGFELSPDVAFGVNVHDYRQHFGVIERLEPLQGDEEDQVFDSRFKENRQDVDLGLTWDPTEELRLAVATYNVGGSEATNADLQEVPLARGVVGAAWIHDRFSVGAEVGINPGETPLAVGVNYRITPWLGVDLAAANRYDTIQTGLDFTPGRFRGTFRIRWDDQEDAAVHVGAGMGW